MGETRLLVVDDEPIVRESLGAWLREDGYVVDAVEGGREAIEAVRTGSYAAVLLDIRMPGIDGLETLRELRRLIPSLPVVMMTAYAEVSTAVAAMKAGAEDYVTKPFDPDEISAIVRQIVERRAAPGTLAATVAGGDAAWSYEDFSGCSAAMARAVDLARRAAETNVSILLLGERGLGKECLARAIHAAGRRRTEAFVTVHCGGLTEPVLEAELFGYEKGALPSSPAAKKGRLELADRGTLYLDEVAALPQRLQLALLHALEDRAVLRLGGDTRRPVDLRVIGASSDDVDRLVESGAFLAAVHGVLSGVAIRIPPLRERPEDIAHLAGRLLERRRTEVGKDVEAISPEALKVLAAQDWPGNVRQLSRTIERAIVACPGKVIGPEHLPLGRS
jgi:two-component system response regulator HydG